MSGFLALSITKAGKGPKSCNPLKKFPLGGFASKLE
jgi:hypothetical protein